MRILTLPNDLAKYYLEARDSYETAFQALVVALPDFPEEERRNFYVNAFKDLCDYAIKVTNIEMDIMKTLGISSFEKIEANKIYTMEEEHDD